MPEDKARALDAGLKIVSTEIAELRRADVHLTAVTTSPEDFQRAKQAIMDLVTRGCGELEAAGCIAPAGDPRQGSLFGGGR